MIIIGPETRELLWSIQDGRRFGIVGPKGSVPYPIVASFGGVSHAAAGVVSQARTSAYGGIAGAALIVASLQGGTLSASASSTLTAAAGFSTCSMSAGASATCSISVVAEITSITTWSDTTAKTLHRIRPMVY